MITDATPIRLHPSLQSVLIGASSVADFFFVAVGQTFLPVLSAVEGSVLKNLPEYSVPPDSSLCRKDAKNEKNRPSSLVLQTHRPSQERLKSRFAV